MANSSDEQVPKVEIDIEFCNNCAFKEECDKIAKMVNESQPNVEVKCHRGRRGAFEVTMGEKVIFSRLTTDQWPKADEIAKLIDYATHGRSIISERCHIM